MHKKANKVLQRWRVLAFYRIASCLRMWYIFWLVNFDSFCRHSRVSDTDEKCDSVDWPTRLLRFVTFVHLPFSFRSLDPSLLRTCLWRALYAGLLGPGCLIILYVFFSLEAAVNRLREIMLWSSSRLMSFPWVVVNPYYISIICTFTVIHYLNYPDLLSYWPRSSVGRALEVLIQRSWVQTPPRSNFHWPVGTPKFPLKGYTQWGLGVSAVLPTSGTQTYI